MNKKGFTLIELVTVIALLGVISLIAFVSIFQVIKRNKVSNCDNLLLSIKSAAKDYASDKRYDWTSNGVKTIYASDLISGNYLSDTIKDPFSNNNAPLTASLIRIKITLNNDYSVSDVTVEYQTGGTYHTVKCSDNKW